MSLLTDDLQYGPLEIYESRVGCGTFQISGISMYTEPSEVVSDLKRKFMRAGDEFMILYGDNVQTRTIGDDLAKYIEDQKLGTVVSSLPSHNGNYMMSPERMTKTWVWNVNMLALKNWDGLGEKKTVVESTIRRARRTMDIPTW
jgi:hypothetical protein